MSRKNERSATRFEGVHQRAFKSKRWRGRPDVTFEIDYRDPVTGKRIRKSVGRKSEGMTAETAAAIRAGMVSEARERARTGDVYVDTARPLTLGQAWDLYLNDWMRARGLPSAVNDSYLFERHLRHLENMPLSSLTPLHLDRLTADLRAKGLSAQSTLYIVGLIRRTMRRMMKWRKWRGADPFVDFDMPKVANNARERILTPAQAQGLLEALSITSPRMYHMSLVALHCGLRFGEIAALTRADVDFDRMALLIRDPKNGRDRYALMTPTVADLLRKLLARARGELIFPSRTGEVMKQVSDAYFRTVAALELNISSELDADGRPVEITDNRLRVVFHTWRHTYGSWLGAAGNTGQTIADRLGHSSVQMSERYTHLFSAERRRTATIIEHMFRHGSPPFGALIPEPPQS